jgi:hypothetical protein
MARSGLAQAGARASLSERPVVGASLGPRVGALALASSLAGRHVKDFPYPAIPPSSSPRQQAALDVIAARHPRPITSAQLATELQLPPGALNVTLRSLQRRQLIAAVRATARRRGGWTLWPWP